MTGEGDEDGRGGGGGYSGSFPDVFGVLGVFFDDGEDAGGDDSVGFAEIVVDFWGIGGVG